MANQDRTDTNKGGMGGGQGGTTGQGMGGQSGGGQDGGGNTGGAGGSFSQGSSGSQDWVTMTREPEEGRGGDRSREEERGQRQEERGQRDQERQGGDRDRQQERGQSERNREYGSSLSSLRLRAIVRVHHRAAPESVFGSDVWHQAQRIAFGNEHERSALRHRSD